VAAGLAELDQWLADLMRRGLATVQAAPGDLWERPAARLVDAQAPGLARLVRECATVPASGAGWQERLLERLGRLHLLIEGYRRLDSLPEPLRADVRDLIGWTQGQEEVLRRPGVRDCWLVVSLRVEAEERLRVRRAWLWGRTSGRAALLLDFAHGRESFATALAAGQVLDGELAFFPSAYPLRALLKGFRTEPAPAWRPTGYPTILAATAAYGAALADQLWLETFPLLLSSVWPVRQGERWLVRDAAGHWLPLRPGGVTGWELLALSGGHPLTLFGEWDGDRLLPLRVWQGAGAGPAPAARAV
jgi:hypothetical protein